MPLDKPRVKKILVISLSNIGDVVLTFPVIDVLRDEFPQAKISIVLGPKAQTLVSDNPLFEKVYIYDKKKMGPKTLMWIMALRRAHFDLVVDLRHTAIPLFVGSRYRTSMLIHKAPYMHMKDKHLSRLKTIYPFEACPHSRLSVYISDSDKKCVQPLIRGGRYVVFAPGAANHSKRWPQQNFVDVGNYLMKTHSCKVVLVGSEEDRLIAESIEKGMYYSAVNLCGRITLTQLAEVINHASLAIVNDSAPMHMASYLNIPVIALFGPSNPMHYGPWSEQSLYLQKNQNCLKCRNPKMSFEHTCLANITSQDVINAFEFTSKGVILKQP